MTPAARQSSGMVRLAWFLTRRNITKLKSDVDRDRTLCRLLLFEGEQYLTMDPKDWDTFIQESDHSEASQSHSVPNREMEPPFKFLGPDGQLQRCRSSDKYPIMGGV